MNLISKILLLLLPFVALGDSVTCRIRAQTITSYEDASSCIRSIPWSKTVADQTLDAVKGAIEMNVFKDILLSPPAPFESLAADLSAQIEALRVTMTSDYDLHQSISNVFMALKDPHSVYAKPACYRAFVFALPFGFSPALEGDDLVIRLSSLPPAQQFVEFQYIAAHPEYAQYLGKKVLTIDGVEPVQAVAAWADQNAYISKSHAARFNRAVKGDFFLRPQTVFGIPEQASLAVTLEGVDGPVALPWLAYTSVDLYTAADLEALCPAASAAANGLAAAAAPAAPVEVSLPSTPLARFLAEVDGLVARPNAAVPSSRPASGAQEDDNASPDLRRLYTSSYVEAYYYEHASAGANDSAVAPTAMLRIPSFSPDTIPKFVDALIAAVKAISAAKPQRLLIDVRSNGGGYVSLGYKTAQYLSPRIYPLFGEYKIRHNDITGALLASSFSNEKRYDWLSRSEIAGDLWYNPGQDLTFKKHDNTTFTHTYSSPYSFDIADDEADAAAAYDKLAQHPPGITFDPQHMAVITDGLCGSTCCCFVKRLAEAHGAKMIGVGGPWAGGKPYEGAFDVASFAGGSVLDTLFLDGERAKFAAGDPALKALPPTFPRNGYLRFAFEEISSWDWKTRATGTPLEFLVDPADWVIPVWPTSDAGEIAPAALTRVFQLASPYFDTCAAWEVAVDSACPVANGRGGRPCIAATGKFDTTRCAVLDCDAGYYLNADGICAAVPPVVTTYTFPWWGALLIVVAALVVLAMSASAILAIRRKRALSAAKPAAVRGEDERALLSSQA